MDFDKQRDLRGMNISKWDRMESAWGVSPNDGLPMWVADMDFDAPDFLQAEVQRLMTRGHYGYFVGLETYYDTVANWLDTRHGWKPDPDWMFSTYGLGNAIAMAIQSCTAPGDNVAIFTPVYHEFSAKIRRTGRVVTELPLITDDAGKYVMDFASYDARMTGNEKMLILCSPHNPAGRVWRQDELSALADFCIRHDLIVISDEIHQDLVFAGHKHLPLAVAAPELTDRLIMMNAASKTFNIAGTRTGCVIIPDDALRARFRAFFSTLDIQPNLFGIGLTQAAYSPEGAAWVDQLNAYLEGNYRRFKAGIDQIPGLSVMPMEGTYLSWVDFGSTGMSPDEIADRVYRKAKIAVTPGPNLGTGGESFMRFCLATNRGRIDDGIDRMVRAFSDLQ